MIDDDTPTSGDGAKIRKAPLTERQRVRRERVLPDVRRQIVETITQGGLSGAQAARRHGVSEATVHRIMKADRNAKPSLALNKLESSGVRSRRVKSAGALRSTRGRQALTVEQQREIVQRICAGTDMSTDLALEFGVHKSTISRILRKDQITSEPALIIKHDPRELSRRIAKGIAKAALEGRSSGTKPKFSPDIQLAITQAATGGNATFSSLARTYGVDPSTITRIVRTNRLRSLDDRPQSLEEIFNDLSKAELELIKDKKQL